jgi:hypothetical protein
VQYGSGIKAYALNLLMAQMISLNLTSEPDNVRAPDSLFSTKVVLSIQGRRFARGRRSLGPSMLARSGRVNLGGGSSHRPPASTGG